MSSIFLEIITHDYYEQRVSENALSTALSMAIAGAQEKAQHPAKRGNATLQGRRCRLGQGVC